MRLLQKGINLFLDEVAAKEGEAFAEMELHILCYVGSTAFALERLDGRWISNRASEECESKKSKTEKVIAIKYRPVRDLLQKWRGTAVLLVPGILGGTSLMSDVLVKLSGLP